MAKGSTVKSALRTIQEYKESGAPQPGMFSTMLEAIRNAPFENAPGEEWINYLKPGRIVTREGVQFPLKQSEIELIGLDDIDSDMGLEGFIAPKVKYSKEEMLKELSAQGEYRPSFGLTINRQVVNPLTGRRVDAGVESVIPDEWVAGAAEVGEGPLGELTELRRLEVGQTKYGQNQANSSQLSHVSPGSTYEESITRLPGLIDEAQHFNRDTVSHSRTSTHTQDGRKIRLIEEIQSDINQRAAEKLYRDPQDLESGLITEREVRRTLSTEEISEALEDGTLISEGRRGYLTADRQMDLEVIVDEMEEMNLQKRALKRGEFTELLGGDATTTEAREALLILNEQLEGSAQELDRLRARVSNSPFKKPQEYSALELRKQLLNAVEEDADYLALTRAKDQLERYGGAGHSRRRTEGMEKMYDQVYYGELRKLANRYKIPLVEVDVKLGGLREIGDADIRPDFMANHDFENATDVYDYMEAVYMDSTQKADALEGAADFGAWAEDMRQTIRNHPDVPSNSGKVLIDRIQRNSSRLEDVVTDLWDDANQDINGGPEKFTDRAKPLEQAIKKDMEDLWDRYLRDLGPTVERTKTFPALELTPEIRQKIKDVGVPLAQNEQEGEPQVMAAALGGLVRKYAEGGHVRSLQAQMEGTTIEEEVKKYRMGELRRVQEAAEEAERDAELRRRWAEGDTATDDGTGLKYLKAVTRSLAGAVPFIDDSTRQYLSDTMRFVPEGFASMLQTLDPETGESSFMMPLMPIPIESVMYGGMSEEDYRSGNEAIMEHNAKVKPNIIDDTIMMPGLPGMFFPDTFGEPPEWAVEAMQRSEQVTQNTRDMMEIGDPEGFVQGTAEGLGMMLGQVPVPGGALKSAAQPLLGPLKRAATQIGRRIPGSVKTALKVPATIAGAGLEFFNPTIDPAMRNYLMGAGFAGAINKGAQMFGGDEPTEEEQLQQLSEKQLQYQEYATDTWRELDFDGRMDLISDEKVGDAAWYYLAPEEKAAFIEELKGRGYDIAEEDPEEFAKGGYVKKLLKMRDGVIDARGVFEQKMLDDAIEDAGLEMPDDVFDETFSEAFKEPPPFDPDNPSTYEPKNIIGLYDDIKVESTEHLPPSPEFQEWLDDFRNKLDIREADHSEVMSTMNFDYKPGDIVRGQLPNSRYEVLFQDFNRKTGRAKYRVKGEDGSEFDLPDFGIDGRHGPTGNIYESRGMDILAADAAEDFEEFIGFYPEDLELGEYLGRDMFEGKAFMEDGSEVRFTYDLREADPRNRFEVKED